MEWNAQARAIDEEYADVDRASLFTIPSGVTYLDGNSLGAMPSMARAAMDVAMEHEWATGLIRSWNSADWMHLPQRVGDRIASLTGAHPGTVVAADTTTLNLHKVLQAAVAQRKDRRVILTDIDNFPTDLYVVDAVARQHDMEVRAVRRSEMQDALGDDVAVLTLTHVDYRTSEMVDMGTLTAAAHAVGALAVWDLAHSAGAVPVQLAGTGVDYAVGCGYKFLNGGPGAPAFLYVAPNHLAQSVHPIDGWMGHANPFAFDRAYAPAEGITQFLVGTHPVLALRSLLGALSVFDGVDMQRVHAKSIAMADLFHAMADVLLVPRGFRIASHRDSASRGSHVALGHPQGYAIVQALIARGIIGDFRRPDVLRFGFAPLYNAAADVVRLVETVVELVDTDAIDASVNESTVI